MSIDLVWCGEGLAPEWPWGVTLQPLNPPSAFAAAVERHAAATPAVALLHWALPDPPPTATDLERLLAGVGDVWHAGLRLGAAGQPATIDYVAPGWMLNRDPDPGDEATSWRLTLDACLVRTQVVRVLGHVDPGFETLVCAALELGHRWIRSGAILRHVPCLVPPTATMPPLVIPLVDHLRFIHRRYGPKWVLWSGWRMIAGKAGIRPVLAAARQILREPITGCGSYDPLTRPLSESPALGVTVLIPTLERYPWIEVVLAQLREQTVPPHQVIVVDQTAVERRRPELYEQFDDLPMTVLYRDRRGQSSARNAGLDIATGDAILFIDDDDELPVDLIERHLALLATTGVDASCGVALEPGEQRRTMAVRRRQSDVFPTNNTLLRRSALSVSGLFDLAYDHGIRADGDLGMRLYLGGALLLLDSENEVLHHRAPMGGLREYGARITTYRGSRSTLLERNRLAVTEVYLARRYFTDRQVAEMLMLRRLGALSRHGSIVQRAARFLVQLAMLPSTNRQMAAACQGAEDLLDRYPVIPPLQPLAR